MQSRQWLVVVACASSEWLAQPEDFLRTPADRVPPRWVHGIVEAENEQDAYDVGLRAWDAGRLAGQEPGDELLNWYVAPLAHGTSPRGRERLRVRRGPYEMPSKAVTGIESASSGFLK